MSDNESLGDDDGKTLINRKRLLREIKKRPALYNKHMDEYNDRRLREKLWSEVFVQLIQNWNELSADEKKTTGTEIKKKWKNLKDCFQREIAIQRKVSSRPKCTKRRRYIHYDELSFLLPFVTEAETSSNFSLYDDDVKQEYYQDTSNSVDENCIKVEEMDTPNVSRRSTSVISYEASSLIAPNDELSEEKHFALMLVPMLARLNEEQKHYAKVEILNVMRNASLL